MRRSFDPDAILDRNAETFAERAEAHDASDDFVAENYAALKAEKVFSALVPADLGGGGARHGDMCAFLRRLAHACPSTALALAMHQHLVAAAAANHKAGRPGKALLEKVAAGELVLVSTGANDWLESNGAAERVPGGYRVTATKPFASGSPAGDMLITSAAHDDPSDGPQVLHFPVPLSADGVEPLGDWAALGMRGTGSQTVRLNGVFVPEEAIALRRPRGPFHPAFAVILAVAMPIIMSVYQGVAESAAGRALDLARPRRDDPATQALAGELEGVLAQVRSAVDRMIGLAADYDFVPTAELASAVLVQKTIAADAAIAAVEKAMALAGGAGYMRKAGLERLLRDVHGAQFHPLPAKRQHLFTGRLALGLDPVTAVEAAELREAA